MDKLENLLKPFDYMLDESKCHLEFETIGRFADGSIVLRLNKRINESTCFPFTTLSMYVQKAKLEKYEFVVKNWHVNVEFMKFLMKETSYFIDTKKMVESQFGESPIWKFNI